MHRAPPAYVKLSASAMRQLEEAAEADAAARRARAAELAAAAQAGSRVQAAGSGRAAAQAAAPAHAAANAKGAGVTSPAPADGPGFTDSRGQGPGPMDSRHGRPLPKSALKVSACSAAPSASAASGRSASFAAPGPGSWIVDRSTPNGAPVPSAPSCAACEAEGPGSRVPSAPSCAACEVPAAAAILAAASSHADSTRAQRPSSGPFASALFASAAGAPSPGSSPSPTHKGRISTPKKRSVTFADQVPPEARLRVEQPTSTCASLSDWAAAANAPLYCRAPSAAVDAAASLSARGISLRAANLGANAPLELAQHVPMSFVHGQKAPPPSVGVLLDQDHRDQTTYF